MQKKFKPYDEGQIIKEFRGLVQEDYLALTQDVNITDLVTAKKRLKSYRGE